MKLFRFGKKREAVPLRITETDRLWVEDSFSWLIKVFGYPYRESEQILLTENYFPKTFRAEQILTENIISDLCTLLAIKEGTITFEVHSDIRDVYGVPYEIQGKPFETDFVAVDGGYKIYVANSLQKHPKRLIFGLVYECIRIRLTHSNLQFDTGEDTDLFIYIAGIYFGFGVLLAQNLNITGRMNDGFWETKWNYISEMPNEVMAFGLAMHSALIGNNTPKWKVDLPNEIRSQFEGSLNFLTNNRSRLFNEMELKSNELFKSAFDKYLKNEFEEAIEDLQKVLFITEDVTMKADVYNNLGYYNVRLMRYDEGVKHFKNAIKTMPDYGYANDNLGYALIQLGNLEEGRKWLDKAFMTENNDVAYTYRNLALYHGHL